MTKNILYGAVVVGALLGAAAFFGLTPFGKEIVGQAFGATANSTNSSQNQLFIYGWNLANGTSTSILNTSGNDVWATQLQYNCSGVGSSNTPYTGAGLASVTFKAATTSTSHVTDTSASNVAVTNTNLAVSFTLATSSANQLVASSTLSVGGQILNEDIPPNAYITFFVSATNTAVCNVGVQII